MLNTYSRLCSLRANSQRDLRVNNQQDASSIQFFILSRNSTCFVTKQKKIGYLMHLVGYLYENYHNARSLEHKARKSSDSSLLCIHCASDLVPCISEVLSLRKHTYICICIRIEGLLVVCRT